MPSLLLATALLVAILIAISVVDWRTMRIPDQMSALLLVCGLAATWFLNRPVESAVIGAIAGYVALFAVSRLYLAARGREGLGLGDAKLLGGAGAWLGWAGLPFVVLIASVAGLAYVACRRLAGTTLQANNAVPFGPFLCIGVIAVWLAQAVAYF